MSKLSRGFMAVAAVVLLASCNGWLNVTPENAISDKDLFSTGFGCRNALNGIYANLAGDELYGRELTWGFLSAVSQQYNQKTRTESPLYADAAALVYNSVETEPVVTAIWEKGYRVIANLNKLIEHVVKADSRLFEYGEEEKNLIYAEALALRGMMHFDLLRLFAPAPVTNPSGGYLPYRDSYQDNIAGKIGVEEFIEKVLKDLIAAEEILRRFDTEIHPKAMYASNMYQPTAEWNARYRFYSSMYVDEMGIFFWSRGLRLNYMALLGLQARVCLYAGPRFYQNAKMAATELYDRFYKEKGWVGFTSEGNITCNLDSRYTKVSHDVLFGLYKKQLAADYESSVWRTSGASGTTRLPLANVRTLFASDKTGVYTDYRLDFLLGTTNETRSKYYSLKYNPSIEATVSGMENPMIPVIRFGEVCHILAEICCHEGKINEGIAYLEIVRRARGAARSLSLTVKTREELMEEILLDIRKEMLAEGGTFYAYKRLNLPHVPGSDEEGEVRMSGAYVLPIPSSETLN
ncbi:RagB/SusD family nutrient uptake outer membrane protein [Alistipes sp.]|uniref:RagB/SusD family nutrient uptake outer membrane protein n=1 Tax=Alistipes sp. TaxID=1872444 RepID=UPI0025C67F14|nr:RagB/SusD family nutrient uptake outer membrane protein [Alistipes sp.]